jgi:beta-ribofuranosylaminobenzene 5'-phosphate synthase
MTIKIPTRLHLTLIAMHDGGYRQNGGVGFAIDAPNLAVAMVPNDVLVIEDSREDAFQRDELQRAKEILLAIINNKGFQKVYKASIQGDVPTHMGFGSSTAVRLALVEGLYLINDEPYTKEEIITASQRGGVSGIGVQTYFEGGMVLDIGRSSQSAFVPSSAMETTEKKLPLVCKQIKMPKWHIGICVPNISPKSEDEEKSFFQEVCPIGPTESYETLYHVVYGVVAATLEDDFQDFAKAIKAIQSCHWKNAERDLYGKALLKIEDELYACGAEAVGMSSLGASLYFVGENIEAVIESAKDRLPECKLWPSSPNNQGREIIDG